jgi:homocitrate synthase NifV
MGAERFRYCDTFGVLDPISTFERLSNLKESLTIELEFHGHNDFGMATANTLCAIEAGIQFVDTTVGGLGMRAGNASLEELVMALKGSNGVNLFLPEKVLWQLNDYVDQAANTRTKSNGILYEVADKEH